MCGGPSSQEKSIAAQQASFYGTLQGSFNTMFAGQTAILSSLNSALTPIISAGVGQFGFTPAEAAAMRTQASAGTATQYANASKAIGERFASYGGGNEFLPSGAANQAQSNAALAAAQQESSQQLGITMAGYEQGRQNYFSALGAEQGVAGMYNPTGYAGQATGAGNAAFGSYETMWNQEQQSSPWNIVGGVLGGAVGAGLDAFTGGLGTMGAKALGGGLGPVTKNT